MRKLPSRKPHRKGGKKRSWKGEKRRIRARWKPTRRQIEIATGKHLDEIGEAFGKFRLSTQEDDHMFRTRLLIFWSLDNGSLSRRKAEHYTR